VSAIGGHTRRRSMSRQQVPIANQHTDAPLWELPVDADRFALARLALQTEQWQDAELMGRALLAETVERARSRGLARATATKVDAACVHDAESTLVKVVDRITATTPSIAKTTLTATGSDREAPRVLHLGRLLADTLFLTNRLDECLTFCAEAMRAGILPRNDCFADLLRGWIHQRRHQIQAAFNLSQERLRRGSVEMPPEIRASFMHLRGLCELHLGRPRQAQQRLRDAVALCRTAGALETQAEALDALGMIERIYGRLPAARRRLEEALRLNTRLGKTARRAQNLMNLAVLYTKSGLPQRALQLLDDSPEFRLSVAPPQRPLMSRLARAKALLELDRVSDARQEARLALGLASKGRFPRVEALALEVLGDCTLSEGRSVQARRYYQQALKVCGHNVAGFQAAGADLAAGLQRRMGQAFLLENDGARAEILLRRAVQLAQECEERYEEGIARRLLALVYEQMGQHARATEACQRALATLREMGAELQLAHTLKVAAEIRYAWSDEGAAKQTSPDDHLEMAWSYLVEARRLYEKLQYEDGQRACRQVMERIRAAGPPPWRRHSGMGVTGGMGATCQSAGKAEDEAWPWSPGGSVAATCEYRSSNEKPVTFVAQAAISRRLLSLAEVAAASDEPVLVTGETGSGKELIARLIHARSTRWAKLWVAVNCAAIPAALFEREFFGHRAGAFTGAAEDRLGLCERADGGTLFLDEIGEMPWLLQAKLLRLLQEGVYRRLGDPEERRVDLRVVAATNADLDLSMERGRFRRDLYYRLRVFDLPVPPLRERGEDIAALTRHFVERILSEEAEPEDLFEPDVISALQIYPWPGNVRELEGVIKRLVLLALHEGKATVEMLPPEIRQATAVEPSGCGIMGAVGEGGELSLTRHLERTEREWIVQALNQAGGNRTMAARSLGISRNTLYKKMQRLRIRALSW